MQPRLFPRASTSVRAAGTLGLALALAAPATHAAASHDGKRFDPGATMTTPAERAPKELARAAFMIGEWDVDYTTYAADTVAHTARARATITYFNRGHGVMERLHCADADGDGYALDTIGLLVYSLRDSAWGLGEANSWAENITVSSGDFAPDGRLVLRDARRSGGGIPLTLYRETIARTGPGAFTIERATSGDRGRTWTRTLVKAYARRKSGDDTFRPATDYGTPAPDLPPQAHQFDFLVGEWDFHHDLTLPGGREVSFPANETAVYMLGGHCVMEYSWYDVDTNHPDAATTIVRLYNAAMRRWECLYCTNRADALLHFGGVKEGDTIVLHQFGANAAGSPWLRWVFHDVGPAHYGWYGQTSRDRGATWKKTWIITADRKNS